MGKVQLFSGHNGRWVGGSSGLRHPAEPSCAFLDLASYKINRNGRRRVEIQGGKSSCTSPLSCEQVVCFLAAPTSKHEEDTIETAQKNWRNLQLDPDVQKKIKFKYQTWVSRRALGMTAASRQRELSTQVGREKQKSARRKSSTLLRPEIPGTRVNPGPSPLSPYTVWPHLFRNAPHECAPCY